MKEKLLKIWDEEVASFAVAHGHDSVGDRYIADLREAIAAETWEDDTSPSAFAFKLDTLTKRDEDVYRFVNINLVWKVLERGKQLLAANVYHAPKKSDPGYTWYKDYETQIF